MIIGKLLYVIFRVLIDQILIAQGSIRFIFPAIFIGAIVSFYNIILGAPFIGFGIYLAWFFRDPQRTIIINSSKIYAVADGTLISINKSNSEIKFAIRMSPFNVHLNRAPITGTVTKIKHQPGTHKSVYFARVEESNERNLIVIENDDVYCEILQITGIFARRIECWIIQGEKIQQGQKIGMIRFGSQSNVLIKLKHTGKAIKQIVNEGDKVKAGIHSLMELY